METWEISLVVLILRGAYTPCYTVGKEEAREMLTSVARAHFRKREGFAHLLIIYALLIRILGTTQCR